MRSWRGCNYVTGVTHKAFSYYYYYYYYYYSLQMDLYPVTVALQYTHKITHTLKTIYKHNKVRVVHTLKTQNGNCSLTKNLSRRISINSKYAASPLPAQCSIHLAQLHRHFTRFPHFPNTNLIILTSCTYN